MPQLKPHQQEFCQDRIERTFVGGTVNWDGLNVGLFGDMGTGKTPAVIILLEWVRRILKAKNAPEAKFPALIICPSTVKVNWKAEFRRFAPWVKHILIVSGDREQRDEQLAEIANYDYVITNYDTIRIHQQQFQAMPAFLAIVVDEAHAIKNREAQRTRAIKSINAVFRMALTGTPQTRKPDDLWSILHFVDPGPEFYRTYQDDRRIRYRGASPEWGSYWSFTSQYCEWERNRFGSRIIGGKNLKELHERLLSTGTMVRWRRAEVLNLEPITYKYVALESTPDQAKLYQQLADGFALYVDGMGALNRMQIRGLLAQLIYFRRATTLTPAEFALALGGNPKFAPGLEVPVSDQGAKQQWLLSFIENYLDGDKALVFSDWTGCTRPLTERLLRHGVETLTIDGSTPERERYEIQEEFNDGTATVLVGSPAAYEGLNLQAANYVVFMNLPWSPKDIFQAYSRAHRMGQVKPVTVIFPFLTDTIDVRMADALRRKQSDIDLAIDGGQVKAAQLFEITTKEQVLDLVGKSHEFSDFSSQLALQSVV